MKGNEVRMVEVCKQNQRLYCSRCFKCYLCLKEKKSPCHLKLDVRLHWFFTIPRKAAAEWKSGIQHVLWLWWCQLFFPFLFGEVGWEEGLLFFFLLSFWIYKVVRFITVSFWFILLQTGFSEQNIHLIVFKLHILFKETQSFYIVYLQDG